MVATPIDLRPEVEPQGGPRRFVYVQTFGCQMNVNDTDRIYQVLAPYNYRPTDDPAQASLILLNTCSVRDKAEQKMMSQLGRLAPLKEYNDDLVLAVAGCVAQQEGEQLLKKVPYLDLVFGPDHIAELPQLVERARARERVSETRFAKRKEFAFIEAAPREETRVSEFVTIMKGCDKVCSFCIVPFTRGREVSKAADAVVREVKRLVAAGAREVTLLGQNVNSFGRDLQGDRVPTFAQLLRDVDAVAGLERLRFTTSHPMDCIDDLVACFGELRTLCEFFHLPVQSGSDRVLQEMRRFYTVAEYRAAVAALRQQCPGIALSTDIIVGFPGETEADHEATLALLDEVRFTTIYSFAYSERPGTAASRLGDSVPLAVKKRRLAEVQGLQRKITDAWLASFAGAQTEVLFEGPSALTEAGPRSQRVVAQLFKTPQVMGRTPHNVKVNVAATDVDALRSWPGRVGRVQIDEIGRNALRGKLIGWV